ncbi:MAG: Flp pilus assembly protein CpaB [Anaerolineae bacterium]|jgi:pilus assembly protein CpaB|nr:Flp pilus assembly protein CpaB [Anaerolineae bacterium]MDH7473538.1 Flp pilus assembly protein CpaB [Anaerolineae bacterium]
MRGGRFLIIVGGLLILATVGLVAFYFLTTMGGPPGPGEATPVGAAATPTEAPPLPTRKVLIAVQDIPSCTEIPQDAVAEWEVPERDIPSDVVLTKSEILGPGMHPIALQPILRGQPIASSMLSSREEIMRQGLDSACLIPRGKVAVAFPVTELSSVAYALQPGDRVDVLISVSYVDLDARYQLKLPVILTGGEDCLAGCQPTGEQRERTLTQLTVQNAEVLMIGPWGAGIPFPVEELPVEATPVPGEGEGPPQVTTPSAQKTYNVVILVVSPQDALVLKWARENGALIDLALRSGVAGGDQDLFSTEPVTLEYMVRRFGMGPPPKLDYGLENKFGQATTAPAGTQ